VVVPQRIQQADPWIKQEIKVARYTTGQLARYGKPITSYVKPKWWLVIETVELNDKKPVG